ncbi:hypothetical protein [uncultured Thiodictyon sp.]|uniref:hypothetical protein n=1 Tax=uncultured Thiodictyon sp. TaxID=1846217 RepID=UPI0025F70219|nr:hypothetical protein [uncultured Thiodictyon sp.]
MAAVLRVLMGRAALGCGAPRCRLTAAGLGDELDEGCATLARIWTDYEQFNEHDMLEESHACH